MKKLLNAMSEFLRLEAAGGVLLFFAAVFAVLLANSPLSGLYGRVLDTPVEVRVGAFEIAKPLLLWINDGLMAIFFFLVGLELKREVLEGELSRPSQIVLPAAAAVGGMLAPGLIYAGFTWGDALLLRGWAIPTATDIAFAIGLLTLFGRRVPVGLKIFLLTLAILDDLGAIIIIALFYTEKLSASALILAGVAAAGLALFNRRGVTALPPYLLVGALMWAAVLKSGVHATLAGVLLAFFIPLRTPDPEASEPPLRQLERELHPMVAFVILPLFAFANSGVSLDGITPVALAQPVPAGIVLGLLLGKAIGVFGASLIVVGLGWARLPSQVDWPQIFGVALLCGVGFTMSLFIAGLAFEGEAARLAVESRLGILCGSLAAGVAGTVTLRFALPKS